MSEFCPDCGGILSLPLSIGLPRECYTCLKIFSFYTGETEERRYTVHFNDPYVYSRERGEKFDDQGVPLPQKIKIEEGVEEDKRKDIMSEKIVKIEIEGGLGIKMEKGSEIEIEGGPGIKMEKGSEIEIERGPGIKMEKGSEIQIEGGPGIKMEKGSEIQIEGGPGIKMEKTDEIEIEGGLGIKMEKIDEVEMEGVVGYNVEVEKEIKREQYQSDWRNLTIIDLEDDKTNIFVKSEYVPEGPVVSRDCRICGHSEMSYATLQLRSADEGQTVFYTCTNFLCRFKESENS